MAIAPNRPLRRPGDRPWTDPRAWRLPRLTRRHWVVVVAGLAAAVIVHRTTADAAAARAALGETAPVWVATRALEPGHRIAAPDVERVEWPVGLRPDSAVSTDPAGRHLRDALGEGEALTDARIGGDVGGPAALLPEGWRALAVPADGAVVPLASGQLVDLLATPFDGAGDTIVVVADARVVAVDERSVTVGVPRSRATTVADVLARGVVTLALVG